MYPKKWYFISSNSLPFMHAFKCIYYLFCNILIRLEFIILEKPFIHSMNLSSLFYDVLYIKQNVLNSSITQVFFTLSISFLISGKKPGGTSWYILLCLKNLVRFSYLYIRWIFSKNFCFNLFLIIASYQLILSQFHLNFLTFLDFILTPSIHFNKYGYFFWAILNFFLYP